MSLNQVENGLLENVVRPVFISGGAQSARQGIVTPSGSNPAATTGGADYTFAWANGATVNHVLLQNNTAAVVNYDIDQAASAGSITLAAGATVFLDITMSALHLFTAANENVNGATSGNIVVRGLL